MSAYRTFVDPLFVSDAVWRFDARQK